MALITCPDCGRRISDAASVCIGCGRPMTPAPYAPPPLAPLAGPPDAYAAVAATSWAPPPAAGGHACPACGSHALAPLGLVQADAASAVRLAPPEKRVVLRTPGVAYVAALVLSLMPFLLAARGGFMGGVLIMVLGAAFLLLWVRSLRDEDAERWNHEVFPRLSAAWDRSLICRSCGAVHDPGAAAPMSPARAQSPPTPWGESPGR